MSAVALLAAGLCGASPAGASAEKTERAQAIELLASVPQSYRAGCAIDPPQATDAAIGPQAAHIVAELRCHPGNGADTAFYSQFDDNASMNAAFDAYNVEPGDGENCPGSGTWDHDGETAGRWGCYTADNFDGADHVAIIVWTQDASNILSSAYRHDDDLDAINTWWSSDEAGPLAEPDRDGLPKVLTTTQWFTNSKALKRVAPSGIRPSCKPVAPTSDALGTLLFPRRMWITGGITCEPKGIAVVDYFKIAARGSSTSATDALFDDIAKTDVHPDDVRAQVGTLSCAERGTWSRAKKKVGEYACWYNDNQGDAAMTWTDSAQGILAYAASNDADAKPLLKFWEGDSGPEAARR